MRRPAQTVIDGTAKAAFGEGFQRMWRSWRAEVEAEAVDWAREQSRKGLMPSDLAFRGAPVITSKVALPSFCVACVSTQSKPPCLRDLLTACTEPKP